MKKRRRWLRRAVYSVLAVVLLAVAGFVGWAKTPLGPDARATAALSTTAAVTVERTDWIVFRPAQGNATTGFIFYPGGRVDPRSYAPLMQRIAERGFVAVIVPMPLNLAVFAPNRGGEVIAAFPGVQHWAVGGHSLGGAMACSFVASHPDAADGLVLWAAYPASSTDLSKLPLHVVSLVGTNDGVLNRDTFAATKALLPPSTQYIEIAGSNHAQFGSYGAQPGDHPATISPDAQQAQTVAATVALLQQIRQ